MAETRQLKVVVVGDEKSARKSIRVVGDGLGEAKEKSERAAKGIERFNERAAATAEHAGKAMLALGVVAAGVGASLAAALDLDAAKAKFAAQVGPEEAGRLGKIAGNLYTKNFGESVADNMEALRKVMTSGLIPEGATDRDIERITGKVQNLARVFDQDVNQSARAAGQLIRTGMAKNADEALDILTRGFQVTGDHAEDLLDTFTEYSTQFRKLGIDGKMSLGLIAQGLRAGARDADKVADALKEFSIRAVDGSQTTADGFKMLGLNANKMAADVAKGGSSASAALDLVLDRLRGMKDPVKQSQAAVALFGTQAEDLGAALYALDPSSAVESLGKVAGAADDMGKALQQSASAQLEMFRRKVQTAIVDKLAGAVPTIMSFADWMGRNKEWVGPVAAGLGAVAAALTVLTVAAKIFTAVQAALNVVMMANPIGLIVLAIIALVAAFAVAWKNSETFRNIVTGVFDAVWSAIKLVWDWIKNNWPLLLSILTGPIGAAVIWVIRNWDTVKAATSAVWNWIKSAVSTAVNGVKNAVSGMVSSVKGAITRVYDTVSGIKKRITGIFSSAKKWLVDAGRKILQGLIDGISGMVGKLKDKLSGVTDLIPEWKGPLDKDKVLLKPAGQAIMSGLVDGINLGKPKVEQTLRHVTDSIGASGRGLAADRLGAATPAAAAGVTVIVNVAGTVMAERDLARAIALTVRDEIARNGKRNGGRTGL